MGDENDGITGGSSVDGGSSESIKVPLSRQSSVT